MMVYKTCILLVLLLINGCSCDKLQIVTVATQETDGYHRFMNSAKKYGIDVKVLGLGEKWRGGDVTKYSGGGQKVGLVKDALHKWKDQTDLVVMFVDSYDVVFTGSSKEILKAFRKFHSKVVFSAEAFCWPSEAMAPLYPKVPANEKPFLNSGGYIGYAPDLYEVVAHKQIADNDDDQLYFTEIYLNQELREKWSLKLDTRSEIFQNLNGAMEDVQIKFKGNGSYMYNLKTGTIPIVIHGNGPIKVQFNSITNYLPDVWTPSDGCSTCSKDMISLNDVQETSFPNVLVSVHLPNATPFIDLFFEHILTLDYPKHKTDVLIHYMVDYHEVDVKTFIDTFGSQYKSVKILQPSDKLSDNEGRNMALKLCQSAQCDYIFMLDGLVQLENIITLKRLIERNRGVIAPLLVRPGKLWSNFWGALTPEGFYKRSDDYADIAQYKKVGLWNVPYISQAVLMKRSVIDQIIGGFQVDQLDPDMAICTTLRNKGIFMFIDNQNSYGYLVNGDHYDSTHLNGDLYEIFENSYAWEKKYIHPDYHKLLQTDYKIDEPCPDVYWMPVISPKFCEELIGEMENFGEWSGGKNSDPRLAGGYENVPTVDIHTNQIGWEKHWLEFLKTYIAPLNAKVFQGYYTESRAIMNFIVRYRPGEQDRLRPHHDASTYTINIALNKVHQDYEGGGVRFLRYNCNVTELRLGWLLMHPGRLTHQHEGLPTTNGTRYIMVSFIDP